MPSPGESSATGGARGGGGSGSRGGGDGDDGDQNHAPGRYPPGKEGKPRAKGAGATHTAGGAFSSGASAAAGKRKGRWDDDLEGGESARRKLSGKGKERAKGKGKGRLMVREYMG